MNNIKTDEQLIEDFIKFYREIGKIPTTRMIDNCQWMSCSETYRKKFGGIKNISKLAGIDVVGLEHRTEKKYVSEDTALEMLKFQTNEKHKTSHLLLTIKDINNNPDMPCASVYSTRLSGIKNAYKLIGVDYDKYNHNATKNHIFNQYLKLSKKLKRTPKANDLKKYSKKGEIATYNTFIRFFGSLYTLQSEANLKHNKNNCPPKSVEILLKELETLCKKIGRVPMVQDIDNDEQTSSYGAYLYNLGGLTNALLKIGYTRTQLKNKNIHITPNGTVCYSRLEYLFSRVLENYNVYFKKEIKYRDHIKDLKKSYRFDFMINLNNKIIFVEIFGITGVQDYYKKTKEKIKLCKDNNLNLIEVYPNLLWSSKQEEVYNFLQEKSKKFK